MYTKILKDSAASTKAWQTRGGSSKPLINGKGSSKTRMPLKGHKYHDKTDDELKFIVRDAGAAAKAMSSHNPTAEGKYLDQMNDASTVLYYRKGLMSKKTDTEHINSLAATLGIV